VEAYLFPPSLSRFCITSRHQPDIVNRQTSHHHRNEGDNIVIRHHRHNQYGRGAVATEVVIIRQSSFQRGFSQPTKGLLAFIILSFRFIAGHVKIR